MQRYNLLAMSELTFYTEDELISLDELQEEIQEFDDYVQSTDVAAMQSKFIVPHFFIFVSLTHS